MRRFVVRYSPRAVDDLQSAFDWGVENWGREEASSWVTKIEKLIDQRLSNSPVACSLAPESVNLWVEVRHLVIGRYRVLFNVGEAGVFILRIMGPFSGRTLEIEESDAS